MEDDAGEEQRQEDPDREKNFHTVTAAVPVNFNSTVNHKNNRYGKEYICCRLPGINILIADGEQVFTENVSKNNKPANRKKDQVRPVYGYQALDFPVEVVICKKEPEHCKGRIDEINTHIGNPGYDFAAERGVSVYQKRRHLRQTAATQENQHSGQQPGFRVPAFTGHITAVQYQKHQNNSDTVCDHDGL